MLAPDVPAMLARREEEEQGGVLARAMIGTNSLLDTNLSTWEKKPQSVLIKGGALAQ